MAVEGPAAILNMTFWRKEDENPIHKTSLSGEKLIAWSAEQSIQRVNTVKNIKNRIPNTRFSEVVLSCVSASFYNYFQLVRWVSGLNRHQIDALIAEEMENPPTNIHFNSSAVCLS